MRLTRRRARSDCFRARSLARTIGLISIPFPTILRPAGAPRLPLPCSDRPPVYNCEKGGIAVAKSEV